MRIAAYIGGLLGLALLVALMIRSDLSAMLHALDSGGLQLLWLVPYRALFFALYAVGWLALLGPYDPRRRAGVGYLFWVTAVREAVDRLLPVASVGGGVVGVRLLRWRGLATVPVSATVIVEMVTTLITVYVFTGLGLLLLVEFDATGRDYHRLLLAFTLTLPVPVATVLLLRFGSAFGRLQKFLRPMVGESMTSEQAESLDHELRACLRRGRRLLASGALQLAALISGCFEIWFALRLFGHPVSWATALVLESMTQAVRHLAFVVPGGLGVQEAGLVIFGHAFGISGDLALAVSMAKRIREVLCGLPALMSWQWSESRRIHGLAGNATQ
jgi:putative membrane protein